MLHLLGSKTHIKPVHADLNLTSCDFSNDDCHFSVSGHFSVCQVCIQVGWAMTAARRRSVGQAGWMIRIRARHSRAQRSRRSSEHKNMHYHLIIVLSAVFFSPHF